MRVAKLAVMVAAVGCGWSAAWAAAPEQPAGKPAPTAEKNAVAHPWAEWTPLLGTWSPDGAKGSFTFVRGLADHVLLRHNHLELPAANGRPAQVHDDLMVIYREGEHVRAHYFDNEGHDIQYAVEFPSPDRIVFVSDQVKGQPRFRLVYAITGPNKVNVAFEIAPPNAPDRFRPYLSGSAHRIGLPASTP